MKQKKRFAAVLLSAALLALPLTGCSMPGFLQTKATPTPAPEDLALSLAGIPKDTTLLTVNGEAVTAEEYLFFLYQTADYMNQSAQYTGSAGIDWTQDVSGVSMADYCKNNALEIAKLHAVLGQRAEQAGCAYGTEEETQYQSDLAQTVADLGGEEQFQLRLSRSGLSEEGFRRLNQASFNYSNLQDALYGTGAPSAPTDQSMDAYIEENDLLSAKHILLLTVDMNNYDAQTGAYASLDEQTVAEKKAQAEELLKQLRASDDPAALFDTLMNQYSEDSGLSSNPDGYLFTAGDMDPAFETAVRALKVGEISDLVKTSYGYHIILRQDPDTESLRSQYISEQMNAMLDDLVSAAQVETTKEYDALDPQAYYTKLVEHQAQVDEQLSALQSAAPTASDSAAPSDGS